MVKREGGGGVKHWKHGWVPLTAYAKQIADGKRPPPGFKDSAAGRRNYTNLGDITGAKASADRIRAHRLAQQATLVKPDVGPEGGPHTRGTKYDTPVANVGMTYSPTAARDPRVAQLRGEGSQEVWDSQPTYEYKFAGANVLATEEFLRSKPINKVVNGEPFREGYDPQILRTDEGDVIVDGHHRVAMYMALGRGEMNAKIVDVRKGESVDSAVAYGVRIKGLSDDIQAKAKGAEPTTTNVLMGVAAHAGGRMDGLDHRLKATPSLNRKLRDKSLTKRMTPEAYAADLNDALRYTVVTPPETYTESAQSALADFKTRGYKVDEIKNAWPHDLDYKGMNTTLVTPDGLKFEVQFHTEPSLVAKEAQHGDFEVARDLAVPPDIRKAALDRMLVNGRLMTKPPGIDAIKSTIPVKSSIPRIPGVDWPGFAN